jgi:hypothetical protein
MFEIGPWGCLFYETAQTFQRAVLIPDPPEARVNKQEADLEQIVFQKFAISKPKCLVSK